MNNELMVINDFDTTQRISQVLYKSNYFTDVKSEAQAIVKVMAGQELGLPPFASMAGIHIIQGKPVLGSNVIATLVKNDPRYDYKIGRCDNATCHIEWYEGGLAVGSVVFTMEEAKAAGLAHKDNWKKYPSDMLFARAISRGARRFAPGIFGGAPVYTPDEMGADVDEDGHIIDMVDMKDTPVDMRDGPKWTPEPDVEEDPALSDNSQGPETTEPVKAKAEPLFNGKTADARAWLEEKGVCTLGVVADALVMTGLYNDRHHVANALSGVDGAELREKGLKVDLRNNVKGTLMIFDWGVERKQVEAE